MTVSKLVSASVLDGSQRAREIDFQLVPFEWWFKSPELTRFQSKRRSFYSIDSGESFETTIDENDERKAQ